MMMMMMMKKNTQSSNQSFNILTLFLSSIRFFHVISLYPQNANLQALIKWWEWVKETLLSLYSSPRYIHTSTYRSNRTNRTTTTTTRTNITTAFAHTASDILHTCLLSLLLHLLIVYSYLMHQTELFSLTSSLPSFLLFCCGCCWRCCGCCCLVRWKQQ